MGLGISFLTPTTPKGPKNPQTHSHKRVAIIVVRVIFAAVADVVVVGRE
jgi:hypothetical protein